MTLRPNDYDRSGDIIPDSVSEETQGEYTEEDMKQAIKENFDIGYEMAKAKFSPKQGEWKYKGYKTFYCNKCNKRADDRYSFCPNCGADMRGAE